jgi:hypothetical protein
MEEFMLPCLNKKLFGMDCPGCGAQRAAAFLFDGEFVAAFKMYPAIYPLLFLAIFLVINIFVKFKYSEKIKVILIVTSILCILANFIIKLYTNH